VKNLTVVSTMPDRRRRLGLLLDTRQIKKMISSYVGENKTFAQQYLAGELEIEFNPQGTLAERIRAGGAGIPAFFTRTGAGTLIAEGKEEREIDGERYVMERGLVADLLSCMLEGRYRGQSRLSQDRAQFQSMMATAGKVTVAEVENLVEPADRSRPHHHAGRVVKRIVHIPNAVKHIEQRTVRKRSWLEKGVPVMAWTAIRLAERAAKELRDGFYVNLGIGIPTLVSNYIPTGMSVQLQSENGMLGFGPFPYEERRIRPDQCRQADGHRNPDHQLFLLGRQLRHDSRRTYRSSILGAMQVAENGDLANWMIRARW